MIKLFSCEEPELNILSLTWNTYFVVLLGRYYPRMRLSVVMSFTSKQTDFTSKSQQVALWHHMYVRSSQLSQTLKV